MTKYKEDQRKSFAYRFVPESIFTFSPLFENWILLKRLHFDLIVK